MPDLLQHNFGTKSEANFGGGWWMKPLVPEDPEELEAFMETLLRWDVSLEQYQMYLGGAVPESPRAGSEVVKSPPRKQPRRQTARPVTG